MLRAPLSPPATTARPALRFFLFSPLTQSCSFSRSLPLPLSHSVSISRYFFLSIIRHLSRRVLPRYDNDWYLSLSLFPPLYFPFYFSLSPPPLLARVSLSLRSRLVARFLRHASASASYCREDARRCRSSAVAVTAIDVGRIRNFDTRRSLSRARTASLSRSLSRGLLAPVARGFRNEWLIRRSPR